MSENKLLGSTECLDNYCANDHILSLGPKMSIGTNISKKAVLTMTKVLGPVFPRIIESDKPQETNYKGAQIFLTSTVAIIRTFFGT